MNTVLVVEDERNINEMIGYNLKAAGMSVCSAFDGEEALRLFESETPDFVVLDLMLPKMDGYQVMKEIRKRRNVPILMLTAKGDELDRVLGLELGADDYVTKPFSPRELVARVKAVLRRTESIPDSSDSGLVSAQGIDLDPASHIVRFRGEETELTLKEFTLLKLFMENPGKVFTRDNLLNTIWGYDFLGESRTIDVHVRRLRQKFGEHGISPEILKTVHGVGYKFEAENV